MADKAAAVASWVTRLCSLLLGGGDDRPVRFSEALLCHPPRGTANLVGNDTHIVHGVLNDRPSANACLTLTR